MLQNHYHTNTLKAMRLISIALLMLMAGPLMAQAPLADKIYMVNESALENINIIELNKKTVKVRNQEGRELNFKAKEILLAFNGNGDFLTFPIKSQDVSYFQSTAAHNAGADLIITSYGQLVPVDISQENDAEIIYHDLNSGETNRKVSTNLVAAIIYKEGNHRLLASPSRVSGILSQMEEKVTAARMAIYDHAEKPGMEPFTSIEENSPAIEEKSVPAKGTFTAAEKDRKPSIDIDHETYSQKAIQKTEELATYLAIISDRNNRMDETNKAVELAVQLFIDEKAQFEVSGKEGKTRYPVRAYLNRLKLLQYDRIEITWTDISYVSDLKKGMDGNYYGIITLQQRFKGYKDNRMVYGDLTEKNIEVKVMAYQKESEGTQQQLWDVFLSDVGVVVTKFDE